MATEFRHQFPRETFNTQERIETDETAGWTPVANRSVTSRIELLNFKEKLKASD